MDAAQDEQSVLDSGPDDARADDAVEAADERRAALASGLRAQRQNDVAILVLSVAVAAAAFLLAVTPARDGVSALGFQLPEVCGAKRLGVSCPGCGLTRSFVLGIRGDPAAFRLHPAGPILLVTMLGQIPYRIFRLARARRLEREDLVDLADQRWEGMWRVFKIGLIVAIMAGWLLRIALG